MRDSDPIPEVQGTGTFSSEATHVIVCYRTRPGIILTYKVLVREGLVCSFSNHMGGRTMARAVLFSEKNWRENFREPPSVGTAIHLPREPKIETRLISTSAVP